MNLIKTSLYSAVSTAVNFLSGFVVIKVVAVKIGPAGVALVGQFQNTITILAMLATGAITSGVVKYLATYHGDAAKQQRVITTAVTIVIICSSLIGLGVLSASVYLSRSAFNTTDYWQVYALYALFVTIISLNTLMAAVFNGLKQIQTLTVINITGSVAGVLFTVIFAQFFGVKGVLISSNFTALVLFITNCWFLKKLPSIKWKPSFKKVDREIVKMLFSFTLMNLASGIMLPFSQLLIRDKIIRNFSIEQAGYWQGVTRISDYYILFITTVLSIYYLPRLSELKEKHELRAEIRKGYKIILPAVGVMAFTIWLLKDYIVHILFSAKFEPMIPLFKYQLIGDFLKIGSWLLAFLMLSKALTKTYIITEILFSCIFVCSSYLFIDSYGIIGATYAFAITYFIYWIMMSFLMKKYIF